jgi:hypothetical protein
MNSSVSIDETLATIEVMRCQEESGYTVGDYLAQLPASVTVEDPPVDAQCRVIMQKWCKEIAQYCGYNNEVVDIAMNCLDRFMSTAEGSSILLDRSQYQLAVMTALYTTVKIHCHEAMDPALVSNLSQGAHSPKAVEAMEVRMLSALQWRVNPPTALSFVSKILELVPEHLMNDEERQAITDLTKFQLELAMETYEFSILPASSIAIASLMNAVESVSSNTAFVKDFEPSVCRLASVDATALRDVRINLYESINGVEPMDMQFTADMEDTTVEETTKQFSETNHEIGTSPRSVSI